MKRFLTPKNIFIILAMLALIVASKMFISVPLPHIQLPPETVFVLGGFKVTNTILTMLVADLILLAVAFKVGNNMKLVPGRLQGFMEMIVQYWRDMADQLVGRELGSKMLPLVLTMFLLIVSTNWLELVPGVDSIGWACESGKCPGEETVAPEDLPDHTYFTGFRWPNEDSGIFMATARDEADHHGDEEHGDEVDHEGDAAEEDHGDESHESEEDHDTEGMLGVSQAHAAEAKTELSIGPVAEKPLDASGSSGAKVLVPFFRVTASDLNFTLALALIAFVAIEWAGFRELGFGYLKKFFNFDFSHGVGQGLLNIFVGTLEAISEVARIISFSFRLFGNLFAGQILLFVMPFLIPFLVVLPFFGLETFVGMIQGFVFAMLTLVFASVAIQPHDH